MGSNTHKEIFRDKETGLSKEVEDELINKQMYSILTINNGKRNIVLKRSLYRKNDQYINDEYYNSINEYRKKLKKILFPNAPDDLSLRKLITKFIRIGNNNESIFKYQDGMGTTIDYHKAYNYFCDLNRGEILGNKKKRISEITTKIKELNSKYHVRVVKTFKEKLIYKEKIYKFKEQNFLKLDYVDEYKNIDILNYELIENIDESTEELYNIKRKINILEDRIKQENDKKFRCDNEVLKALYDDVDANFHNLNKSFEEFILFHNNMCDLRLNTYQKDLDKLKDLLKVKEKELLEIRNKYSKEFIEFKSELNSKTNSTFIEYYDSKNEYDNMKVDFLSYLELNNESDILKKDIEEIEKNLNLIDYRSRLNEIFKIISKEILDVEYTFKFNDNEEEMPISSDNIKGRIGSGDKKTLVAAVDFAFDEFFEERNLDLPRFIIHDKMELTPVVELKKVFNYCRNHSLQYIVPIMRDRIGELDVNDKEIILELSKDDKLFKF